MQNKYQTNLIINQSINQDVWENPPVAGCGAAAGGGVESGDALLQSAVNSGPVMQTPVSLSLLRPLPGTLCSLSSRLPLSRRSGGSLTADSRSQIITLPSAAPSAIKYGFIRSVFRRGTPRQKHVLFSLTYSTGDTNQQ